MTIMNKENNYCGIACFVFSMLLDYNTWRYEWMHENNWETYEYFTIFTNKCTIALLVLSIIFKYANIRCCFMLLVGICMLMKTVHDVDEIQIIYYYFEILTRKYDISVIWMMFND